MQLLECITIKYDLKFEKKIFKAYNIESPTLVVEDCIYLVTAVFTNRHTKSRFRGFFLIVLLLYKILYNDKLTWTEIDNMLF